MRFSAQSLTGFFLSFILGLFILASPVFAQEPQPKQDLHTYTQTVMIEVMSSLTCVLAGVDPVNPSQKCLGIANGKIGPVDSSGGAIGAMGSLIALTYTPSLNTGDYVRYLAGNFGVTKSAYAQQNGIGLQGLSPLVPIWAAFRNITYLLFVLIFLAIGFAIMLRVRIDPRTVMSIENQIPKIIIGLILVTFSFAIVGFLIDLMWLFIYLVIGVFRTIPGVNISDSFANIQGLNALEVANNISGGIFGIATNSTNGIREIVTGLFAGEGTPLNALSDIPGLGGILGGIANGIISVLFFIIIAIAILFSLFRLWFTLIKAYVMILIVAVFSPFWILAGMLPGSKLSFVSLLRELGANLVSFPATIVLFLLAKTFIDAFAGPSENPLFVPPLIGNPGDYKALGAIVGLGMILIAPDINKMMRRALQAPDFDFSAIGQAIGVGVQAPGRIIGGGAQLAFGPDTSSGELRYPTGARGTVGTVLRAIGMMR